MIFKAGAAIKFKCWIVPIIHFEMNRVDAHLARLLFDERDRLAAKPATPVRGGDIQFIDERVVSMKLETEANGQNNVAREAGAVEKQPDSSKLRKRQKPVKRRARDSFIKDNFAGLLLGKAAHHGHERGFVLQTRFTKFQLGQLIPRSVR